MYSENFAKIYDMAGWGAFSENLYQRLKKYTPQNGTVLDIACGTGTLANLLTQNGNSVTAFDASKGMVTQAKKKNKKINFFVGNMETFELNKKFDLVVCAYDSINHIKNWNAFLKRVHNHLSENGHFIFDFNTTIGLQNWNNKYVTENDSSICIFSGTYNKNKKKANLEIKCFVKDPRVKERYTLIQDEFISYTYSFEQVKKWLKESGFSFTYLYPPKGNKPGRISLVCKKL